jgi:protein-tyrosine-phosphatase
MALAGFRLVPAARLVLPLADGEVDTVITLCSEQERPVFLGQATRLHWPFPDPAAGPPAPRETVLARFRQVRDGIRARLTVTRMTG